MSIIFTILRFLGIFNLVDGKNKFSGSGLGKLLLVLVIISAGAWLLWTVGENNRLKEQVAKIQAETIATREKNRADALAAQLKNEEFASELSKKLQEQYAQENARLISQRNKDNAVLDALVKKQKDSDLQKQDEELRIKNPDALIVRENARLACLYDLTSDATCEDMK